jgi:hypothetical protein
LRIAGQQALFFYLFVVALGEAWHFSLALGDLGVRNV